MNEIVASRSSARELLIDVVATMTGKEIRPAFIAWAQTAPGKIALICIFSITWAGLYLFQDLSQIIIPSPIVIPAVIACSFAPRYRWHITGLVTLAIFFSNPFWVATALPALIAKQEGVTDQINFFYWELGIGLLVLCSNMALVYCKRRFSKSRLVQRPVLSLLLLYFLLVFIASQHVCHGLSQVFLWSFTAAFGGYFWFLAYALQDKSGSPPNQLLQMGNFHSFWNISMVPVGKGVANLKKTEAKNDAEFAASQIKGVRLFLRGMMLLIACGLFLKVMNVYLSIPELDKALESQARGAPYPPFVCWQTLIFSFFEKVLEVTAASHIIVGVVRMAGFQILRNTYNPLQAKTVAEFFNRYSFYFKELLVDFFFFPAFLRHFKRHARLRIIFATFMSAFVGNIIYHFMRSIAWVAVLGFPGAIARLQTYAVYAALLTIGIVASQLRPRRPLSNTLLRDTVWPFFCVFAFFCFIHIFDDDYFKCPLKVALAFLFHLFGVNY
jgi:hypothetical protein